MASVSDIVLENIHFSKINNYKKFDGKFCYVNYLEENLTIK